MPYAVTGLIAKTDFVQQFCAQYPSLRPVVLEQGFCLFPLSDELIESLGVLHSRPLLDSNILPNELTDIFAKLSAIGPLLYFETEYFGGQGDQLAIVFENGKITFGPSKNTIGPINEGLRLLGVKAKVNSDEFDAIGLGTERYTDRWIKRA